MKKLIYPFAIVMAIAAMSCNNSPKQTEVSTEESDTLDLGSIVVKDSKILDSTQIPTYRLMQKQGIAEGAFETLDFSAPAGCAASMPKKIGDLTSGTEFNLYRFDRNRSAEAKAMGFIGSIGKKELLLVQDYARWSEVECEGKKKKYGIGLRLFIHVTRMKGGIDGGLSAISAKVELDRGEATFNLKSLGFGIDGPTISDGLSPTGEYNVENFAKLAIVFNNVLKTLKDSANVAIKPVEIP